MAIAELKIRSWEETDEELILYLYGSGVAVCRVSFG